MRDLADAVESSNITVTGSDLTVVTPKSYSFYFKDKGFEAAVREAFGRPLRIKITIGEASAQPSASLKVASSATEDQATERAMSHPEVQRFQEVFGGEIRKVRNLKE